MAAIGDIADESYRAHALQQVAPFLKREDMLEQALAVTAGLRSGHLGRTDTSIVVNQSKKTTTVGGPARVVMSSFARRLPPRMLADFHCHWIELLGDLASGKRSDLLYALSESAPSIETLGGGEALRETSRSVLNVIRWWK